MGGVAAPEARKWKQEHDKTTEERQRRRQERELGISFEDSDGDGTCMPIPKQIASSSQPALTEKELTLVEYTYNIFLSFGDRHNPGVLTPLQVRRILARFSVFVDEIGA